MSSEQQQSGDPRLNGELQIAVEVLRAEIQSLERVVKMYMSDHKSLHYRIDKVIDDHESRIRDNNEKLANQRGFMIYAAAFIGLIFTAINLVLRFIPGGH